LVATPSKIVIKTTRASDIIPRNFTLRELDGQDAVETLTVIKQDLVTEDQATTIPRDHLQTNLAVKIPKGGYESGTLTLQSLKGVQSGKYGGKVIVHSSNADDVEIPVEVSVKHSWYLPGLVLVVGIAVGYLLNWWDTKGKKRAELVDRLREVQQALVNDEMLNQIFGENIHGYVNAASGKLRNNPPGAEEDVKKAEQKLDEWYYKGADYLQRIDDIKATIFNKIDQSDEEGLRSLDYVVCIREGLLGILKSIGNFGSLVALDEATKKWKDQLNKVQDLFKDLRNLEKDLADFVSQGKIKPDQAKDIETQIGLTRQILKDARSEDELPNVRQEVEAARKAFGNAVQQHASKGVLNLSVQQTPVTPIKKRVPPQVVEKPNIRHLNWLIQLLLVIIAAFVGLVTVYGTNDTFGANKWLSDYLGLFGWGLGVELTRSKLSEIIKSGK
jgi:hypothetical protein